jgi:hypothetical protein
VQTMRENPRFVDFHRPATVGLLVQTDPHWKDYILFYDVNPCNSILVAPKSRHRRRCDAKLNEDRAKAVVNTSNIGRQSTTGI